MAVIDNEKEKVWLYCQLLIDFANAETSDDAGLTYIENIKKSFGFSDKAKQFIEDRDIPREFEGFPTLSGVKSKFNEDENPLKKPKIPLKKIKGYTKTGDIIIAQAKIPTKEGDVVDDSISIYQMVIEEHNHIDNLKKDIYACLKEIHELRCPVQPSDKDMRNSILKDLDKKQWVMFIPGPVIDMKGVEHGKRAMFYFLNTYNELPASPTYVCSGDDGRLTARNIPRFNAEYFLNRYDRYNPDFLTHYYDEPISYCLIEFLRNNEGVHRLKMCPYCKKFFIARDKKRIRCYDHKCRRAFEREKKQRQRSEDPVRYV